MNYYDYIVNISKLFTYPKYLKTLYYLKSYYVFM